MFYVKMFLQYSRYMYRLHELVVDTCSFEKQTFDREFLFLSIIQKDKAGYSHEDPYLFKTCTCDLSLYSTGTQNTWRWGLALGSAPDPRILRWEYQHVGILEPTQTLASGVIGVTPDDNPRRQSVEYRWRWVPNANFLRWPCTFHFFV